MNVLLTGGYGCIGSWITRNLLDSGDRVWIYDLKEDPKRNAPHHGRSARSARSRSCRAMSPIWSACKSTLATHKITHIVHLAGLQVPVCRADPILGAKVNVLGTLAVFEAVRQLQGQIQRLVYTSSAAVFDRRQAYLRTPSGRGAGVRGRLADDVLLIAVHALRRLQVLQRRQRPHLLSGLRHLQRRLAAVDRLRRRPRFRHDQRADQGDQVARLEPPLPHHLRRLCRTCSTSMMSPRSRSAACEAPYQGAKSYNLRGHVVDLPTLHRAWSKSSRRRRS